MLLLSPALDSRYARVPQPVDMARQLGRDRQEVDDFEEQRARTNSSLNKRMVWVSSWKAGATHYIAPGVYLCVLHVLMVCSLCYIVVPTIWPPPPTVRNWYIYKLYVYISYISISSFFHPIIQRV